MLHLTIVGGILVEFFYLHRRRARATISCVFQVGSAGYSVKLQEQERLRMVFSFLPFKGRVRLRNPQHLFQVGRTAPC